MRLPRTSAATLLVAILLVALAGCGSDNPTGTGTPATGSGYGTLAVSLTDGPIDLAQITNLFVTFDSLYVRPVPDSLASDSTAGGPHHVKPIKIITGPVTFDLLSLSNGLTAALGSASLPEGNYRWVSLALDPDGCWLIEADGDTQDVVVPSRHLDIITDFTVVDGQVTNLTLDFDTAASLVLTGNGVYILRPVIRQLPDGVLAASIEGRVWVQTETGLVSAGDYMVPNPRYHQPGGGADSSAAHGRGRDRGHGGRPPDSRGGPGGDYGRLPTLPLTVAYPMIVHARVAGDSTTEEIASVLTTAGARDSLPPGDPRFHQPCHRGTVVGKDGRYILWRLRTDATYELRLFIHPRAGFEIVSGPGSVTLTGDVVGQDFVIAPEEES